MWGNRRVRVQKESVDRMQTEALQIREYIRHHSDADNKEAKEPSRASGNPSICALMAFGSTLDQTQDAH